MSSAHRAAQPRPETLERRRRILSAAMTTFGSKGYNKGPLTEIASSFSESPYTIIWLDTLLGQNVGNALNKGVVDLLSGVGSPDDIIAGVESAAAKG